MPIVSVGYNDSATTFAFSERQNSWTTRYSFTPTCYANCGDAMLSSKDNTNIWIHDVNEIRNKFYGNGWPEESIVEVSFNDFSSDVKVFNSVSAETNASKINATFYLEDEKLELTFPVTGEIMPDGTSVHYNPYITGSDGVEQFTDFEGIKYLPVSRHSPYGLPGIYSDDLTDSNIIYMGSISLDVSLLDDSFFMEQTGSYDFKVRLSDSSGVSIPASFNEAVGDGSLSPVGSEILIPTTNEFKVVVWNGDIPEDSYISAADVSYTASSVKLNCFSVIGQEGDVLTIRYSRRYHSYFQGSPPSFIPSELFVSEFGANLLINSPFDFIFNNGEPLFLLTPQSINGDQPRSTYLRTIFEFRSPTNQGEYIELNAVNCDFNFSKSHHGLNQNT
jgi:hypothetical protein